MKVDFFGWRKMMKKRLTLILAVALMVITCGAMLIGCTPGKPNDYIAKWAKAETDNKSMTTISYEDVQTERKKGDKVEIVNGVKTTEVTIIVSGDTIMEKTVESTKWEDKRTAEIVPTSAYIYEYDKDEDIYNAYNYKYTTDKYEWSAYQVKKENIDNEQKYVELKNAVAEQNSKLTDLSSAFEQTYTKGKGGWFEKTNDDGTKEAVKVVSGDLIFNVTNGDKKVSGQRFELNEKITISSGAGAALTEYKETTTGTLKSVDTNKGKVTYVIDVDGTDYKVGEKVTGAEILKDLQVGTKLSVRVTKNFFGKKSISKVFAVIS